MCCFTETLWLLQTFGGVTCQITVHFVYCNLILTCQLTVHFTHARGIVASHARNSTYSLARCQGVAQVAQL